MNEHLEIIEVNNQSPKSTPQRLRESNSDPDKLSIDEV